MKLKNIIKTNEEDSMLEARLRALELLIRKYTNNKFQQMNIRFIGQIKNGIVRISPRCLKVGDTVEISQIEI